MFEKVNPFHPDKVADRIAGAIVDIAYKKKHDPKCAVEVLIGHGQASVIVETSEQITEEEIKGVIDRIAGEQQEYHIKVVPQDKHLADNQKWKLHCGDNGIFRGCPVTKEQEALCHLARVITSEYSTDGKYIIDGRDVVICQSNCEDDNMEAFTDRNWFVKVNPLGEWTGGLDVDSGATNRKLGSDMGDAVTGGGLHGKDLSKADVTLNIYCHIKANELGHPYELSCAIGDDIVDGKPYSEIVEIARDYIKVVGGFEKFAEWGLL